MLERIDIVTLFPDEFRDMTAIGVTGRAILEERVSLNTWNPRDFAHDRHRTVDDRPYGGGPGMVMLVQPLRDAIRAARNDIGRPCRAALMTPQGRRLDQAAVAELAGRRNLLLVCGRYEGVDERLVELEIDEEWSLGDFVLSGGELAAAAVIDATLRLLPGVLGAEASAEQDSFAEGWLDHPHYTRPERVDGLEVPPVLRCGDHGAIRRWRLKQALGRTWRRRPELLDRIALDPESRELLDEYIRETEHD